MTTNMTRRKAMATCAASSGLLYSLSCTSGPTPEPVEPVTLPDVWGEDFLTQWSPPPGPKPSVKPGTVPIRLSCASYRIRYNSETPVEERVRAIREAGYTACESSDDWRAASDTEIRELQDALKKYDVWYYGIHVFLNNIHPDPESRQNNIRRTIQNI